MTEAIQQRVIAAFETAKKERAYALHMEECGSNAGLRKMNANKAEWLSWLIYFAEKGLEAERAQEVLRRKKSNAHRPEIFLTLRTEASSILRSSKDLDFEGAVDKLLMECLYD